jgi:PAS domain-containing protein
MQMRPDSADHPKPPDYRILAETALDAIVSLDTALAITYFNPAAERTFGFDADEIVGQPLAAIVPERHHHLLEAALGRLTTVDGAHARCSRMAASDSAQWAVQGSNLRPRACKARALAS